jgi:membrane-bound lytic murein transglycosylase MltF
MRAICAVGVGLAILAGAGLAPAATKPASKPAPAKPAAQEAALGVQKWTGDLDGMVKRRQIRALVVFSRTQYFVDKGQQHGTSYEALRAFEDRFNASRKLKHLKVHVVFIPTSRDDLIPALVEGRGDIAVGALSITPERLKRVDFTAPTSTGVNEIAVTGSRSPALTSVEDLSGKDVFARRSSSYWEHLEGLNARFKQEGKPPVKLRAAPETLEDEDLLEMVNAGLLDVVVVDDYKAELWAKVFSGLRLHPEAAVHKDSEFGWAIRKGSPLLKAELDRFVATHGRGTTFGNTVIKKYLKSTKFVKGATTPEEMTKFQRVVQLFRKYGDRYDLDYLLMLAQGYQESRLEQGAKSRVGAIGIMQIMPATGKELKVGDIKQLEPNIHGGVKYVRFMVDQYFADEPMDRLNKGLFAFAAYNAGPGRVGQLRKEAARRGLNPNLWFNHVEVVAAERIGSETVTYVSNIYKYYIAYTLVAEEEAERRKAREQLQQKP